MCTLVTTRYFMSQKFSQDHRENYFEIQDGIDQRCDKPTVCDFDYNKITINNSPQQGQLLEIYIEQRETLIKYGMNFFTGMKKSCPLS